MPVRRIPVERPIRWSRGALCDHQGRGRAGGLEYWRRTGLEVIIARAFPHTGAGQSPRFVVPAFLERLARAPFAGRRPCRPAISTRCETCST